MSKKIEIIGDYKDNITPGVEKSANAIKRRGKEINNSNDGARNSNDKLKNSFGKLGTSLKNAVNGMNGAGNSIGAVGSKVASMSLNLLKAVPVWGAIAAAVVAAGAVIGKVLADVINLADRTDELAERFDMSVVETQKWARVLKLAGTSVEEIIPSMDILQKNMVDAARGSGIMSDAFKTLGVEVLESNGKFKTSEKAFNEVIKKLTGMEDRTRRNALAMEIFGKSGAKLIKVLNQGTAGIENNLKASEKYVTVSEKTAASAGRFNDILDDLKSLFTKIKVEAFAWTIDLLANAFETLLDSPILYFFGALAKVIGGVVYIALLALVKVFQTLDLAIRGVILILKSFFLLFVDGARRLVNLLPNNIVPRGWKKGLEDFTDFLATDFVNSADKAAAAANKLASIKPTTPAKPGGDGGWLDPDDTNSDKLKKQFEFWEEYHKIGKTEYEKDLMDLGWWWEEQIKLWGNSSEKKEILVKVYNDRLSKIKDKYAKEDAERNEAALAAHDKAVAEMEKKAKKAAEYNLKTQNDLIEAAIKWDTIGGDFAGRKSPVLDEWDQQLQEIENSADSAKAALNEAAAVLGRPEYNPIKDAAGGPMDGVFTRTDPYLMLDKLANIEEEAQSARNAVVHEKTNEYVGIVLDGVDKVNNAMFEAFGYAQSLDDERTAKQIENVKQNVRGRRAQEAAIQKIEENAEKERKKRRKAELMVSWAMSIANTAEGISKAFAQGGVAGFATGAAVAVAGAIQTGIILSQISKLAKGGIVGGQGQSDTEPALLTPGEMVLNKGQQSRLFALANGASAPGGAGPNITFNESIVVHGNLDSAAAEQIRVDREKQLMGLKSMMQELSYRGQLSTSVFA